ncbi:MAG TPA: hypothetical protein PLQ12_06535 [Candidatus Defluviicoccus seviourii]|nr:hypothetical protein [Candidatus Defluviicoccus seviourii]
MNRGLPDTIDGVTAAAPRPTAGANACRPGGLKSPLANHLIRPMMVTSSAERS